MSPPNKLNVHVEPELSDARLNAQWARISERIPGPAQRRARTAGVWGLGAACAAALLSFAWFNFARTSPSVWEGSVVASDDSPVNVTLAEGTHIELSPRSRVELLSSSEAAVQLSLGAGSARFDVAKKRWRRFSVRSGAVEVLVTGTQFRVTRTAGVAGERVSVGVEEGSVEVHRAGHDVVRLRAGEQWSSAPDGHVTNEPAAPEPSPEPEESGAGSAPEDELESGSEVARVHHAERKHQQPPEVAREPLPENHAEVEELFERANVARRAGLLRDAAGLFEQLVQEHPQAGHAALSAFELGRIRMDSLSDMRGAVTALERALALDDRRAFAEDALARLTLAYEALGDAKGCLKSRERYLARYPEGVHAHYLAARCAAH
jgi:tetratricopeptide (TPR) repeat protein